MLILDALCNVDASSKRWYHTCRWMHGKRQLQQQKVERSFGLKRIGVGLIRSSFVFSELLVSAQVMPVI